MLGRVFRHAVPFLPESIRRRAYLRHVRFDPHEIQDVTFKLAESFCEREQAFRILQDAYQRRGLVNHVPTGLKISFYSMLPTTAVFIAVRGEEVLATMSLIEDSPLGLPMEEIYSGAIHKLRSGGGRVAEVGALAAVPRARGKGFSLMLFNLMYRWASSRRAIENLVIAVHPRVSSFYRTVLLFEPLGGLRRYGTLRNAPAVALRLNLKEGPTRYRRAYAYGCQTCQTDPAGPASGLNLYHFFVVDEYHNLQMPASEGEELAPLPSWSPEELHFFFAKGAGQPDPPMTRLDSPEEPRPPRAQALTPPIFVSNRLTASSVK